MTITIRIPTVLRDCCNGAAEIAITASTIHEALDQIELSHPSLYRSICDETGAVRRHVNLFINSSLVREAQQFDAPFAPNDILSIMPAVSGG